MMDATIVQLTVLCCITWCIVRCLRQNRHNSHSSVLNLIFLHQFLSLTILQVYQVLSMLVIQQLRRGQTVKACSANAPLHHLTSVLLLIYFTSSLVPCFYLSHTQKLPFCPLCFDLPASSTSPSLLSAGQGQCNCGRCDCKEGWAGKKCEHPLSCSLSLESSLKKCRGTSNLPCFGRGTWSSLSAAVAMVTAAGPYYVLTSWCKIGHFQCFTSLKPSLRGM